MRSESLLPQLLTVLLQVCIKFITGLAYVKRFLLSVLRCVMKGKKKNV